MDGCEDETEDNDDDNDGFQDLLDDCPLTAGSIQMIYLAV